MDLYEVMTTGGSARAFEEERVPDAIVYRILDQARFAPSGANHQGWRVIVIQNKGIARRLRDLYRLGWREYIAFRDAGRIAFAADSSGIVRPDGIDFEEARATSQPNAFVDGLDSVPVLLILCADLEVISFMDISVDRPSIVGGASIYPFAQNILLAARNEGLGGVLTTIICREEPAVKDLLGIPPALAVAGLIALGRPVRNLKRLSRKPVEDFTSVDQFSGPSFPPVPADGASG